MKAVIAAGGMGTRLSHLLGKKPKGMAEIGGMPLLEHQIRWLCREGIQKIFILTGYLGEAIEKYFGDGSSLNVELSYLREDEPLGTAGGILSIKDQLDKTFLFLMGDLLVDADLQRFAAFHRTAGAVATLLAHPNTHPYDSDLLITDQNGCVIQWLRKNEQRSEYCGNLVNAGIVLLETALFSNICGPKRLDLEKDILMPCISDKTIYAYQSSEYIMDAGTPDRLAQVREDYGKGLCAAKSLRKPRPCMFIDRDGTLNIAKGYIRKAEEIQLEKNAAAGIRLVNQSAFLAVVITNQPVLARGDADYSELARIHRRLCTLLGEQGAYLDAIYYCPHHPDSGYPEERKELKIECSCRKPKTGLIDRAAKELNIDLAQSWFIGDTTTDIMTGKNAGLKTAAVETGEGALDGKFPVQPDLRGATLEDCVLKIWNWREHQDELS